MKENSVSEKNTRFGMTGAQDTVWKRPRLICLKSQITKSFVCQVEELKIFNGNLGGKK